MEENKVNATEEKKGVFTKFKEGLKAKKNNEEGTDETKPKSTLKKVGIGVAIAGAGVLCALGIKSKMDKDDVDYNYCQETEDAESEEDVESD